MSDKKMCSIVIFTSQCNIILYYTNELNVNARRHPGQGFKYFFVIYIYFFMKAILKFRPSLQFIYELTSLFIYQSIWSVIVYAKEWIDKSTSLFLGKILGICLIRNRLSQVLFRLEHFIKLIQTGIIATL